MFHVLYHTDRYIYIGLYCTYYQDHTLSPSGSLANASDEFKEESILPYVSFKTFFYVLLFCIMLLGSF